VLYTVHFTAFSLGGGDVFIWTRCICSCWWNSRGNSNSHCPVK